MVTTKVGLNLVVKATYSEPTETMFDMARSFADMMEVSRPVSVYHGLPAQLMEPGAPMTLPSTTQVKTNGDGPDYKVRLT